MEERMFIVIVKGEINESEMSLKRAISEAIECEANTTSHLFVVVMFL